MSSTEQSPVSGAAAPAVPPAGDAGGVGRDPLRTVSLDGLTLKVRSRPPEREGLPPALFVHGLGGSSLNWAALMRELSDTVDGEAIDLPGFGESPPPDNGDYSVTGHTRAVIRYLDAAGRGPVHLVGNSLGGAVATRLAAVRPDLVRTLTLVSPALPELPPQGSAVPTALLGVPGIAGLFNRLTKNWTTERRTREVLALCYGDPSRVTPQEFAAAAEEYDQRLRLPYFWDAMSRTARGLVDAYTLGGQQSLWRQADRVLAPTLLVYGMRDRLVGYRMARRAAAAFRDSRLLTLVEAGHVAMMEYPAAVADGFRRLLADTDGPSAGAALSGSTDSEPAEGE